MIVCRSIVYSVSRVACWLQEETSVVMIKRRYMFVGTHCVVGAKQPVIATLIPIRSNHSM